MICGKVGKFQSEKSVYHANGFVTKRAIRTQKKKQEVGVSVDNLGLEQNLTWPDSDQSPRSAAPVSQRWL